jgi:hypothetical protein
MSGALSEKPIAAAQISSQTAGKKCVEVGISAV